MRTSDSPLTVIIPTWNRRELLRGCLNSLARQTQSCRIVIVDNGSSDGTGEMLRREFPEIEHHFLPHNLGFARAVNHGIRQTSTPFLALLNNDTEADPRWVETGLDAFSRHPEFDFFASRLVNFHHRGRIDSAGDCYSRTGMPYKRGWGEPIERYQRAEPVLAASAGAAFYRHRLFGTVGLFDEDFNIYLEDMEFSLRCQLRGHRCLYLPEAVVYHIEAASDPGRGDVLDASSASPRAGAYYSARRVFWISRNRWLLMCLYQPLRNLPFLAYGWIRSSLFHLLKAGHLGAFVRGVGSGLRMTPRFVRKRVRRRSGRTLTVRELCRLLRAC